MSFQTETKSIAQLSEPTKYLVYMLNDDYTSWEFCLRIITDTFHKTLEEANTITHQIHTQGRGLCGTYLYEIAETKAYTVQSEARKAGFPMKCAVEEE